MLTPVPLESIKEKTLLYHKTMNEIADQLDSKTKATKAVKIDKNAQFIQFYIDKKGLKALNKMAELKGFDCLIGFLGIDTDKGGKITVSFVGGDKKKQILKQHKGEYKTTDLKTNKVKNNQALPGQDQWPPPPPTTLTLKAGSKDTPCLFNLNSKIEDIQKVFL
jgi:hypothetical protein